MSDVRGVPKRDFSIVFWVHLALILTIWASPVLFPWSAIAIGIPLYYLQIGVLGECVLTRAEFGTFKPTYGFYGHYSKYIGLGRYARQIDWATGWILPGALGILGFVLQYLAGVGPVIRIGFLHRLEQYILP